MGMGFNKGRQLNLLGDGGVKIKLGFLGHYNGNKLGDYRLANRHDS